MQGCEAKALSKEAPVSLVPSFLDLLQPLPCVMTCPTFDSFLTVLTGRAFARRRTATGMIVAADAAGKKHHSAYRRVFSAARRSPGGLGPAVFGLILPLPDGAVLPAVDDTLARKRGLKVFGVGMRHDPLLGSRRTAITNWGHCRVVPGVLPKLPFCGDRWPPRWRCCRTRWWCRGSAARATGTTKRRTGRGTRARRRPRPRTCSPRSAARASGARSCRWDSTAGVAETSSTPCSTR